MRTLLFSRTLIERMTMVSTFKIQHIRDTSRTHLKGLYNCYYSETLATLVMCFHVMLERDFFCFCFMIGKCASICSVFFTVLYSGYIDLSNIFGHLYLPRYFHKVVCPVLIIFKNLQNKIILDK